MIVVDTSAWVELLRATGGPADRTLCRLFAERADLLLTEIVVMELLAGTQSPFELRRLGKRLSEFAVLPLIGLTDFRAAAALYRDCRAAGEALRETTDCLIAVPAIRAGAPVLHADADFDKLARHTPLEVVLLDD